MARPKIHIIATCTARKRKPAPPELHLSSIEGDSVPSADKWWKALVSSSAPRTIAQDLYLGQHWSVAKELPSIARDRGWDSHLWIASAGHGLIPAHASIPAYSATFALNHADSVIRTSLIEQRATLARGWWKALARFAGPEAASPRTLREVARKSPRSRILVLGSPDYISAMQEDVIAAGMELESPHHLTVITSEMPDESDAMEPHLVPSTAELQSLVGGSLVSLHARVARALLENPDLDLNSKALGEHLKGLIRESAPRVQHNRSRMTDQDVLRFIQRSLKEDPTTTHTRVLRRLRDEGLACEQGRLRRLFAEQKGTL